MAKLYANTRDVAIRVKAKSRLKTSGGGGGKATLLPKTGGSSRFFKLLEDVTSTGTVAVWAQSSNQNGASLGGHTEVVSWLGIIDGAKVGYVGLFTKVSGKWVFSQGGCIVDCSTDGSLSASGAPSGIVGEGYPGHTVTSDGLSGDVTVTGLPPGLTADTSGNLTGTPTEPGEFFVSFTGSAPMTGPGAVGDCVITRLVRIVISPEL